MTPLEVAALLTFASAYDNRNVTEEAANMWAESLDKNMTLHDAKAVVIQHYAKSTDWIMPAHINAGNRQIRKSRLDPVGTNLTRPRGLTADQELKWERQVYKLIGDGHSQTAAEAQANQTVGYVPPKELPPGEIPDDVREMLDKIRHLGNKYQLPKAE